MRFQKLVSATIKSFITRNVPLDELVSHVMTLGAFDPVFKEPQVPLFQYCFEELKTADTIPKVFLVLKDYFSFFNYDIIEHIITVLSAEEDKANLQSYKRTFDRYAKRRIYECGPHFGPVSDTDHADVFVKVDSRYDNYTVEEIKGFSNKLSDTLHVSSQGVLRLCRVEKGCFQLTFQVPSFVQQEIFPLSREQERALKAEGVIKLTCGEYQFPGEDCAEKLHLEMDASGKFVHVAICKANKCTDLFLRDPLAVEVETFEPMKKKAQLDTNTDSDGVFLISNLSVNYYPKGVTPQTVLCQIVNV